MRINDKLLLLGGGYMHVYDEASLAYDSSKEMSVNVSGYVYVSDNVCVSSIEGKAVWVNSSLEVFSVSDSGMSSYEIRPMKFCDGGREFLFGADRNFGADSMCAIYALESNGEGLDRVTYAIKNYVT